MDYLRNQNMICLSTDEMRHLLTSKMKDDLLIALEESGRSLSSFRDDQKAMEELVEELHRKKLRSKEFIECFYSVLLAEAVYPSEKTRVCFELKMGVDHRKIAMNEFQNLVDVMAEATLTDFAILNADGLRNFQLKQYQKSLDTKSLSNFIKDNVKRYGKNLGQHNLLILIQGDDATIDANGMQTMQVEYEEIHNQLKEENIASKGEILLSVNDRNQRNLLIQVFPNLNKYSYKQILGDDWRNF